LAFDLLIFYLFAAITVGGALLVVGQRNPVYSVMAIVGSFCGLSGLYVLLDAPFVAVVQIIIYAGAILVLFLFTVMLLNASREDGAEWDRSHPYYRPGPTRVGSVLAVVLLGQLVWAMSRLAGSSDMGVGAEQPAASSVRLLGRVLFTDYMFAFEVTSILIIAAMVGAVVLAGRKGN
jgi:NADH-quinone oxidoreductase subunit J